MACVREDEAPDGSDVPSTPDAIEALEALNSQVGAVTDGGGVPTDGVDEALYKAMHALSELQEVTNRYGILAQMLAEEASPWEQEFLQAQNVFAAVLASDVLKTESKAACPAWSSRSEQQEQRH
jgi:hypothetical protein